MSEEDRIRKRVFAGEEDACGGTDEKQELAAQFELLKVIAEQNREKVLEYDAAGDMMSVYRVSNGQFVIEETIEMYVSGGHFGNILVAQEDREAYRAAFRKCLKKPTHMLTDMRCSFRGSEMEWHRLYLASVAGPDNAVARVAGRFISIQKDKLLAEQMRMRAELDALTGVYNHLAFEEMCEAAIRTNGPDAFFLMLDVDNFKQVNDTQGHTVGDMVLRQTGECLKQMVKGRGFAGRLGGDEFAAYVWDVAGEEEMRRLFQELRESLSAIILDMEYSASMGVSVLAGRDVTFQDLYNEADQAVYAAKNGGKNRVVFYTEVESVRQEAGRAAASYEVPAFDEMDERSLLAEFGKCIGYLTKEDYRAGLQKTLESLLDYFRADCAALIYWEDEHFLGIDESHRECAEPMVKMLLHATKRGRRVSFQKLVDAKGSIWIEDAGQICERCPESCEKLKNHQIRSIAGHELRVDFASHGALIVFNQGRHKPERFVLRMLAEYLAARVMLQREMELREHETTHDRLTGLWNRNSFILSENNWKEHMYGSLGVITTDIVGLAELNRDFGYLAGSKKLVEVSKMLKDVFEGYRIYRYDEDEMLVCCPNVARSEFELMVSCLKDKIKDRDFIVAMGYSWNSHASITKQITEAELVMEQDKLYLTYSSDLRQIARQRMVDEVERTMREGRYLVYMQPKVNVHSGRTVGAEALIRQLDPDLGVVSPAVFIPVLERYNMIHMVDLFVLEQVFRFQRAAIDAGREVVPISTNFSKLTIMHPDLLERVKGFAEQYDIPEGLIHIEVTETVGDMDHVVIDRVADSLKALGFKLSMDDFGSHYSNLAVLIQYDFDSAKIDRSMIMDITTNRKSRLVLDYLTSLISDLGINCIAEGVETKEQADIMKETKCEVIQGYYFGKPVPQEEFYDTFIAEQEAG